MNTKTNRERAIDTLFEYLEMGRDDFKARYKDIKNKYEEKIKTIKADIVPTSSRYKVELEDAKKEMDSSIASERERILEQCMSAIEDLEYWEKERVSKIDEETISKLGNLLPENITKDEMDILVERYGNKNYWVDKVLLGMALKAGISDSIATEPSIDVKLGIIHSLAENLGKFLNEYDGTVRSQTEVLLADTVLQRAKKNYTNNYINSTMSDKQIAGLVFDNISSIKNESERAIALHRAMQNANDNVKNILIAKISTSDICGALALTMAGLKESVDLFRISNGAKTFINAENLMNDILVKNKPEEMAGLIIDNMPNNKYLKAMLESELKTNENVKSACEIANIEFSSSKETKYNTINIPDIE